MSARLEGRSRAGSSELYLLATGFRGEREDRGGAQEPDEQPAGQD